VPTVTEENLLQSARARANQSSDVSLKDEINYLKTELKNFRCSTDSRITFLEETVRRQKETISLLMNAYTIFT